VIALSEDSAQRPMTPSARENRAATEAAKLLGFDVYYIPEDFSQCETAENALAYVPAQSNAVKAVWIGFIPDPARYEAIYRECAKKNIWLLNSPEEHLRVQEFDKSYPFIQGLTPESVTVTSPDECNNAIERLGLPVFVKGAIQSRKARGWKACTADNLPDIKRLVESYLSLEGRSRGRVILRKLVRLKHVQSSPQGFPFGREYRVFLHNNKVLGFGYYWEGDDPLMNLSSEEQSTVLSLAIQASTNLNTPYVAIDIGQLESDEWIVIESGDAQFAGVSRIPLLALWSEIRKIAA
jgi:hypothetical protein